MCNLLAHGKATVDQSGRRFKNVGKLHRPKLFVHGQISIQRTGHIYRGCPSVRHGVPVFFTDPIQIHERTRTAATIEAMDFPVSPNHSKHIAAESAHHWFHHINRRSHGQCCIRCISTGLKNIAADPCSERCAGTGHTVATVNRSPPVRERAKRVARFGFGFLFCGQSACG